MRNNYPTERLIRFRAIIKWTLYISLIILAFIISTTGQNAGAKALFLIPLVICISANESEIISGEIGLISGFLLDISSDKLLGSNAIFLVLTGVFTSLLFLHLMRKNIVNVILITIVAAFLHGAVDFFFYFAIWGFEGYKLVFTERTIPSIIYTIISSPFIYLIIKIISIKFGRPEKVVIEEQTETISRG